MERVNNNEFINLIPKLKLKDLLLIEYRIKDWIFMIKTLDKRVFKCNLCCVSITGEISLKSHLDGKKHKLKMRDVTKFYHPQYTYSKDSVLSGKSGDKIILLSNEKVTKNVESQIQPLAQNNIHIRREPESASTAKPLQYKKLIKNPFSQENRILNVEGAKPEINAETVSNDIIIVEDDPPHRDIVAEKRNTVIPKKEPESKSANVPKIQTKTNVKQAKNANTPNYQSDIIIVPTKIKDKIQENTTLNLPVLTNGKTPGLVGVEYVIKILKNYGDKRPKYECGLCELTLDGITMQNHLLGYNHRLRYCEKHFPSAVNHYRKLMESVPEHEVFKVMTPVLDKLAKAIEVHHGRNKPAKCEERDYNSDRQNILLKVFSLRHASEKHGPTFTHVLNVKQIDHFIKTRHTYKSVSTSFIKDECFDEELSEEESQSILTQKYQQQQKQLNYATHTTPSSSLIKTHHPDYTIQYQSESEPQYQSQYQPQYHAQHPTYINQEQTNYARNTENYSLIDDETHKLLVQNFLNKSNIGRPSRHNLRNEPLNGVLHKKIHTNKNYEHANITQKSNVEYSIEDKIRMIRKDFDKYRNDPESYPSYEQEWHSFWKRRKDELIAKGWDHRKYNYQPEWVCFFKERIEELYTERIQVIQEEDRAREQARLEKEENDLKLKYYAKQAKESEEIKNSNEAKWTKNIKRKLHDDFTETKKVIPVLRLLTALEEFLGSLGPKIIDLLSKALQLEKTNPSQVDCIIMTPDNFTLLEIVKEKFKGLLMTGTLHQTNDRAVNKGIHTLEIFLTYAENELGAHNTNLVKKPKQTETFVLNNSPMIRSSQHHQPIRSEVLDEGKVSVGRTGNKSSLSSILTNSIHNKNSGTATNPNSVQTSTPNIISNNSNSTNPCSTTISKMLTYSENKELALKVASALTAQGKNCDLEQLQQLVAVYKVIEAKKRLTGSNICPSDVQQLSNNPNFLSSDNMRNILEMAKEKSINSNILNQQSYSQSAYLQIAGPSSCNRPFSSSDVTHGMPVQANNNNNNANVSMGYMQGANKSSGDLCSTQYGHRNQSTLNYNRSDFPYSSIAHRSSLIERNHSIAGMSDHRGIIRNTGSSQNLNNQFEEETNFIMYGSTIRNNLNN